MKGGYKYNKTWRYKHPEKRYANKNKYYGKTSYSRNCGARWTQAEKELVIKHELSDRELSAILGRSMASIQMQRHKLKGVML